MEFCEKKGKIIVNSCFQHPVKHSRTWPQRRTNPVTKKTVSIYSQIDYIILNQENKQVLTDARSYGGTEISSDHKLVVARIELTWARIYLQRMPNTSQKRFKARQVTQNEENQERYREQIKQETESSKYVAAQQEYKWEKFKEIINVQQKLMLNTRRKQITTRYQIQTLKGCQKNRWT